MCCKIMVKTKMAKKITNTQDENQKKKLFSQV